MKPENDFAEGPCPHCGTGIYLSFVRHNGCCPKCSQPLAVVKGELKKASEAKSA